MATQIRTPAHVWIVGALAFLWNGFGAYDYLMTRMRNTDYLASMMPTVNPQVMLAWVDAFPIWAQFGWGLGVWGGLLGSILLLLRNRWAVPVFAASLVGAILGLGYQIAAAPPLPGAEGAMNDIMPFVIILVALALFLYARAMKAKGVLR
jgi:cyanate permease